MISAGRLIHSFRDGKLKGPATSADYANMISAALALYQVTNEKRFMDDAIGWTAIMNRHYDADGGGYYLAADDTSDLILRPLSASDDAVPNPNATMLQNLTDLYTLTGDTAYLKRADGLLHAFQGAVQTMAIAYTGILSSVLTLIAPQHIVVAGDRSEPEVNPWRKALAEVSMPNAIVQWVTEKEMIAPSSPAANKGRIDGKMAAYVCVGQRCSLPITEPEDLKAKLKEERAVAVQVAAAGV
jgi:hypothetical protein